MYDSWTLDTFTGYLRPDDLPLIPHTVGDLGLTIKTAADAQAISQLQRWPNLSELSE